MFGRFFLAIAVVFGVAVGPLAVSGQCSAQALRQWCKCCPNPAESSCCARPSGPAQRELPAQSLPSTPDAKPALASALTIFVFQPPLIAARTMARPAIAIASTARARLDLLCIRLI